MPAVCQDFKPRRVALDFQQLSPDTGPVTRGMPCLRRFRAGVAPPCGHQPATGPDLNDTTTAPAESTEHATIVLAEPISEETPRPLFADLGLSEPVLRAIAEMGYRRPTPIQEQAIPVVLMGRDVLGAAPMC